MQILKFFYFLLLFILSHKHVLAEKKSYIVYLGGHSHGLEITSADLHRVTNSHVDLLSSFVGSKGKAKDVMFQSYQRHINGFAAFLEDEEAANIASHPDVVSVFPNGIAKLQTSHSWNFMGLETQGGGIHSSSLWKMSNFGEDIIIAHVDTGVWPESKSFDDSGYGPVPSKWKGVCVNDTKLGVPCNKKLIGARYFAEGAIALGDFDIPESRLTPRDYMGHGTHTLSTSSGNFVNASIGDVPIGTIKGGSPRARVAMYKVCWPQCIEADVLQAIDHAIDDGPDVISLSILSKDPLFYDQDPIAIGTFHALKKNIVVVACAGNWYSSGTVKNVAPWIITVGASTIDRSFPSSVLLSNGLKLQGGGIVSKPMAERKYYPLIYSEDAKLLPNMSLSARVCQAGSLDKEKVKGKILVCQSHFETDYISIAARDAGAGGMIIYSAEIFGDIFGDNVETGVGYIPSVRISYYNSILLFKYMNSTTRPTGFITGTSIKYGLRPSPAIAEYSSGGPNVITPDILKPDVTAPGHDIVASYSPKVDGAVVPADFSLLYGTSMACPHVAAVAALLRKVHPDWSLAAIRSALMTTARSRDNTGKPMIKSDIHKKTTPYFYGAGHIQPNRAANPGLVYDLTVDDYFYFLCANGYSQNRIELISGGSYVCPKDATDRNFNYPSITLGNITTVAATAGGVKVVTVSRTLKNVGTAPATYSATIRRPLGVSVTIDPKILTFHKVGDERSFKLTMEVKGNLTSDAFGHLVWSDGIGHRVRSPIVVGSGII